ncbi:MAG: SpoIID/LytB domain-containing protein [Planctomycetota bacterium]|nr:MAG: SpoIID/LytB domain-containing protein [Planctomycetota bacterium]
MGAGTEVSRNVVLLFALAVLLSAAALGLSRPGLIPGLEIGSGLVRAPDADSESSSDDARSAWPAVRVLLGSTARPQHRLEIRGPYRLRVRGDWRVLAQGERLDAATATVDDDGIRLGEDRFPHRELQIDVLESGALWLGGHRYHGDLQLLADGDGQLRAINLVDIESYVASVVNGELPADFPEAARQAQAIAARTYALYHMKSRRESQAFDLYDNTRSQVYGGIEYVADDGRRLAVETSSSRAIAEQTEGMVLVYDGRVINSYYSAVCGGHTAAGLSIFADAAPPLVGVACEGCRDAPRYRWAVELPRADVHARLTAYLDGIGQHLGEIRSVEALDAHDGRLPEVKIEGAKASHRISTAVLRRHVLRTRDLPSAFFSLREQGELVHCEGRGWGHGVGMCQWGARGMAAEGATCPEILDHYYPGCQVRVVR